MNTQRSHFSKTQAKKDALEKLSREMTIHINEQKFPEALSASNAYLAIDRNHPSALFVRAVALNNLLRYEEALKDAELSIKKYEEAALKDTEHSLFIKPPMSQLYYVYILSLAGIGGENNAEKAMTICNDLLKKNPKDVLMLRARSDIWLRKNSKDDAEEKKNVERAFIDLYKILTLAPNDADTHIQYIRILSRLKKYNEALTAIEKAIKLFPQDKALFLSEKINTLHVLGDSLKACSEAEAFVKQYPNMAEGIYQRGRAYYFKKAEDKTDADDQVALKDFESMLKIENVFFKYRALSYIATLYLRQSRYFDAKIIFEQLLALVFSSNEERNQCVNFKVHPHSDNPLAAKQKCEEWLKKEEELKKENENKILMRPYINHMITLAMKKSEEMSKKSEAKTHPLVTLRNVPKTEMPNQRPLFSYSNFQEPYADRYDFEYNQFLKTTLSKNPSIRDAFKPPLNISALQKLLEETIGAVTVRTPRQMGHHAQVKKFANEFLQTFFTNPVNLEATKYLQQKKMDDHDGDPKFKQPTCITFTKLIFDGKPLYLISLSSPSEKENVGMLTQLENFIGPTGQFQGIPVFILRPSPNFLYGKDISMYNFAKLIAKITSHFYPNEKNYIRISCSEKFVVKFLLKLFYEFGYCLKIDGMINLGFYPYLFGRKLSKTEEGYVLPPFENTNSISTNDNMFSIYLRPSCPCCRRNKLGMLRALYEAQQAGEENRKNEKHHSRAKVERKSNIRSLSPLGESENFCRRLSLLNSLQIQRNILPSNNVSTNNAAKEVVSDSWETAADELIAAAAVPQRKAGK